ncbi:hypothetical protein IHC39_000954 [Enterococcus faecalis]|nr:hypothetical protein [Enterococcus faecalis]
MNKQGLIDALDQVKKSVLYTEKHTCNPFKKLIYKEIFHVLCMISTHIDFPIYQEKARYYVKAQESYIVYMVSNKEIHMKKCKRELATVFADKKAAEAVAVLFNGEVEEE